VAYAYEFRIAGRVSAELLSSFDATMSRREQGDTVFERQVRDDGELFGVIGRCELLRLHLIGLRKLPDVVPPGLTA
jgi:hypothetical protein